MQLARGQGNQPNTNVLTSPLFQSAAIFCTYQSEASGNSLFLKEAYSYKHVDWLMFFASQ